jgi:uncharacterized protein involved in exopolysaccharide biosynthesis
MDRVDDLEVVRESVEAEPVLPKPASFLDTLILIAEQKRTILRFTLAVTLLTALVSLIFSPRYTAEVTILPPQQNSGIGALLASQLGSLGSLTAVAGNSIGLKNPGDLYVAMLTGRTVEDAMIQRFDLQREYSKKKLSDARKKLESRTSVVSSPRDGLIRITVEDEDSARSAEMANAYVEELRKLTATIAITEASQRRLFFEQQLAEAKDNLTKAEQALKLTEQNTGVLQVDWQARALIDSAAALRAQVAAKEVQIRSMRSFAADGNPELLMANQQLIALQDQLRKLLGNNAESANDDVLIPKGKLPEAGLEYIRKYRDVKYYETIFELMARQFELAKVDEAREGPVVQVVDRAVPPDKRSFPKRTVLVIAMFLLSVLLSVMYVVSKNALAIRWNDPQNQHSIALLKSHISWSRKA